jgi:hypothetical protein
MLRLIILLCQIMTQKTLSSHIVQMEASQMYGNTMKKPLPIEDYYKMTSGEDSEFDPLEINEEGAFGYFITCDITFPPEVHDYLKELPPLPHRMKISTEEKSHLKNTYKTDPLLLTNLNAEQVVLTVYDKIERILFISSYAEEVLKLGVNKA